MNRCRRWAGFGLWAGCIAIAGAQSPVVTNLVVEGGIQHAGGSVAGAENAAAFGANAQALGPASFAAGINLWATGAASSAQGSYNAAYASNSHAGGVFSMVLPEHTNALIFATGADAQHMRQTLFPDTAHFERLLVFSPANDDTNSVLARWENDLRYVGWPYHYALQSVAEAAYLAATSALHAASQPPGPWTNTVDFGGQAASNLTQIFIAYPTQTQVTVEGTGALEFQGEGFASTADGTWLPTGDKAAFAWVYPLNSGVSEVSVVFQAGDGYEGGAFRLMRYAGKAMFCGGGSCDHLTTSDIPANVWSLFAASYDSANHLNSLFLNGRLIAQHSAWLNTDPDADVAFGAYAYTSGGNITAKIGPSGVYARQLDTNDIAMLYAAGEGTLQPPSNDLAAFWPMLDGSGSTVTDHSGNGRHMTIAGSATWSTAPFGTNIVGFVSVTRTNSFAFVPATHPQQQGDYLVFDGTNGTRWTSLPADLLRYAAVTNLNMNGFAITNVGALTVQGLAKFLGPVSIEPQGDLSMGSFTNRP